MNTQIEGIMPVMLTPFTEQNEIDWAGLERLVEWYIDHGADALFAVAQSEMQCLVSLTEREALGRAVVRQVAGRIPVVVSGHISDDIDAQVEELTVAAKTGADAVILVTTISTPRRPAVRTRSQPRSTRCSRGCRAICRSAFTNARRLIAACFRMTSFAAASTPAASWCLRT